MSDVPTPINVVLVDDNAADNYLHQIVLEKHRIETSVTACETAKRGRTAIDSLRPDGKILVLLDINMPSMTGWEFVASLGLCPADLQSIILVVLTTSINPRDRNRAEQTPEISAFFEKPLTGDVLTEIFSNFFSDGKED